MGPRRATCLPADRLYSELAGTGQKPPNNDEKQKLMFFCYTFFNIDGDIRFILKF
jgi:hypothetical protein